MAPPAGGPTYKSFSLRTQDLGFGDNWVAGWYQAAAARKAATNAAATQVYGTANVSYAGHAFAVAGLLLV